MNQTRLVSLSDTSDRSDFSQRFANAQEEIRKDPYRVGLPGPVLGRKFTEMPVPFPADFWLLEDSTRGTPLGRIGANLSPHYPGVGFLGFFEAVGFEAAEILIQAGQDWLAKKGARTLYGPVNFNTWLSYRFRIDDNDASPRFAFEPVNPPEYPHWFRELGYELSEKYHTDGLDGIEGILDGTRKDFDRASSQGYTFRPFRAEKLLDEEVPRLFEISMQSFKDNFLFEPVPYEFFRELYVPLASKKANITPAYFACDPTGKEVGFFFVFMDGESCVLKTTAIVPSARGLGLSNALLHCSMKTALTQGGKYSISALVRSGIQSESYSRKQKQVWRHSYALFKKEL